MNKDNLKELNEVWKSGALSHFIKRMLLYFDPIDAIVFGAPDDEYDSFIPKIKSMILQENVTIDELADSIFDLFKFSGETQELRRKSRRMAEDLLDLKNS